MSYNRSWYGSGQCLQHLQRFHRLGTKNKNVNFKFWVTGWVARIKIIALLTSTLLRISCERSSIPLQEVVIDELSWWPLLNEIKTFLPWINVVSNKIFFLVLWRQELMRKEEPLEFSRKNKRLGSVLKSRNGKGGVEGLSLLTYVAFLPNSFVSKWNCCLFLSSESLILY